MEVHQAVGETEAVITGEGMEETLIEESSLGDSSSEAETSIYLLLFLSSIV